MWQFPSIQTFISGNAFLIIWTLFGFCGGLIGWISVIHSIRKNTKESSGDFLRMVAFGSVAFLFFAFGAFQLSYIFKEANQCRTLDLSRVKALRVRKMPNENSFTGATIQFNDAAKIQEGLRLLRNSGSGERHKIKGAREKFIYGYQIRLILENDSPATVLYYFSETDNGEKTAVVIPDCGNDSDEIKSTDDIYLSTSFGDWLRETVEPLFKN